MFALIVFAFHDGVLETAQSDCRYLTSGGEFIGLYVDADAGNGSNHLRSIPSIKWIFLFHAR